MKKVILVFTICLGFSIVTMSCRETKKEAHSERSHEHDSDLAKSDGYACPMGCEEKTYESEGACPVCNMVLTRVEGDKLVEHDHDSEKPHQHDDDAKEHHDSSEEHHEHDNDSLYEDHN